MNFFVISDIHGSSLALSQAIEIYKKGLYRKLIICGDILYHGARNPLPEGYNPKEVIDILNNIKDELLVVKGNCESDVDSMVLDFPIMSDYAEVITEERDIFITHGDKYSPDDICKYKNGTIFISGHTHIPTADKKENSFILNPGSISLPKGGFKPSYGIFSNNGWEVRSLKDEKIILSIKF